MIINSVDEKMIANNVKHTFDKTTLTKEELGYVLTMLNPSSYLLRHHTVKNHPITFHISGRDSTKSQAHRPWQVDIINDQHLDKCVIKSRQLGLSELGIAEMLHFADVHSYAAVKCLYTFPTNRQMEEFVGSRLNPVLQKGYYSTIVDPDVDSLKRKKIRNSFLFFRSTATGAALHADHIDYRSLDQHDRVTAGAVISAIESMASSRLVYVPSWSTPTPPNVGIHELYERSDQRVYMHKCDHCGYRQQLDYEKNIECLDEDGVDILAKTVKDGTFRFIWQECKKTLDRWQNGEFGAYAPFRAHEHEVDRVGRNLLVR